MHAALLTLSAILVLTGGIIYCISILRGRTKPHRTTRFVVLVVLTLSFVSILAAHANLGAKIYSGILFGSAIAFLILSIKSGMGGSSLFDWLCLVIALVGVAAWQIAANPLVGIWFAIAAYFVAYIPAFVKTWKNPYTESPWLYMLSATASFLSLIAYRISAVSIFQIYAIASSIVMVGCIYHKSLSWSRPKLPS